VFPPGVYASSITHHSLIFNPRHATHMPVMPKQPTSRATPWRVVLIVCRKCGKKLDGGFGRKHKESLKTALRPLRQRDVRICEAGCLGVCPKGGVTALNATHPGTIHVIPAGADPADAMQTLLGAHHPIDQGRGIERP
jgi:predicted metal-binding protein